MTLIVIAHNDKDIVIGSDALATVEESGVRQPDSNEFKKIILINPKTAVAMTGTLSELSKQFITDFCYYNGAERNVSVLRDKLLQAIEQTPLILHPKEKFQVILTGYTDEEPNIKLLALEPGKSPGSMKADENFFAGGFDNPFKRARELLEEKGVENKPKASDLKKIVKETLEICIDEFKDSKDEKLGGKPDIKVLRKN